MTDCDRVLNWIVEGHLVRELLEREGSRAVARHVIEGPYSLRQLAKATKLSPTYLSGVLNKKVTISPSAFVKVCQVPVTLTEAGKGK